MTYYFAAFLTTISLVAAHISIINPTGTLSYQQGQQMTITWTNEGYDPTTPVQFELADASKGINKVTPLGILLGNATTIGELQIIVTVPSSAPTGPAYTVRADVRGTTGFVYYFSPNFPIGQPVSNGGSGSSNGSPSPSAPANNGGGSSSGPVTTAGAATNSGPGAPTASANGAASVSAKPSSSDSFAFAETLLLVVAMLV